MEDEIAAHLRAGRLEEAESVARRALDEAATEGGSSTPEYLRRCALLARVLQRRGNLGSAEMLRRTMLLACTRLHGERDARTLEAGVALASVELDRGAIDAAIRRYESIEGAAGGAELAAARMALSEIALLRGDAPLAEAHARRALDGAEAPPRRARAAALGVLASALHAQDRFEEAETLLREAIATREDPCDPDLCRAYANLAVTLAELGRADEAAPFVERAVDLARRLYGEGSATLAEAEAVGAQLDAALGRPGAGERGQRSIDTIASQLGSDHWRTQRARDALADVLSGAAPSPGDDEATVLAKVLQKSQAALARGDHRRAIALLEPMVALLPPEGAEPIERAALPILVGALQLAGRDGDAAPHLARMTVLLDAEERRAELQQEMKDAFDAAREGNGEGLRALALGIEACLRAGEPILAAGGAVLFGKLLHAAGVRTAARGQFERAATLLRDAGDEAQATAVEALAATYDE